MLLAVVVALAPAPARAQSVPSGEAALTAEVERLRDAAERENGGDFAAAEQAYRRILEDRPGSLTALISLERILRIEGRMAEMVDVVRTHLDANPESPIGHQMLLRLYADLERPAAFDAAAEAWIRATPDVETPYREIARQLERRGETLAALAMLERGRERLGTPDALALELGSVHGLLGDAAGATRAWSRAIGPDAEGFLPVRRRVSRLPDGGAAVLPLLVDALAEEPTSLGRRRAAAHLAVEAGLDARAATLADGVAAALDGPDRQGFLIEIARDAEAAQLPRIAFWAYGELLEREEPELRPSAIRARRAELALLLGDTTAAAAALEQVAASAPVGSPQARRVAAQRVELTIEEAALDEAERAFDAFRAEHAHAPELSGLAAALARRLLDAGQHARAEAALRGARGGPAAALRARLALRAGDARTARTELMAAAPGLGGAEATDALSLARLLGSLSGGGAELVGEALELRDAGQAGDAVVLIVGRSARLPGEERAALLAFAAHLADEALLWAEAEQIRRTLIAEHPAATETPLAMLALARSLARRPEDAEEARDLLEKLVLEFPDSALVPQARRELERLNFRVPSSGGS